jgi:hypothetical protein
MINVKTIYVRAEFLTGFRPIRVTGVYRLSQLSESLKVLDLNEMYRGWAKNGNTTDTVHISL